jgi:glycosyltransferase involved in cell wall biosynthesis
MQVLYDTHIFSSQRIGGISRYYFELYRGMQQLDCSVKLMGLFVKNQYLLSEKFNKTFIYDPLKVFTFVNRFLLEQTLKRADKATIFHPSTYLPYINKEILPRMVFTIHDMILEKQGNVNADKLYFARKAAKIIAVSEATKQDIMEFWNIDSNKIEVIYHGSSLQPNYAKKPTTIIPDNYLLFIGIRKGYKNFIPMVRAIMPLLKKYPDLYLVCAGRSLFTQEEENLFKELGIRNKLIALCKLSDNELAYLYCKAKAFLFPSLNEGFGIPILEAWACETPVVLSDNPCFKEVAADAGFYFTPDSEESIRHQVEEILSNSSLSTELIKKGKDRLRLFSWSKAVEQTYKVYQSLV